MINSKLKEDFRKYCTSKGINASVFDDFTGFQNRLSPYILEEHEFRATQMDIWSRLLRDRIIWFNNDVSEDTAGIIEAQLLYLDNIEEAPITIHIDSPGGECYRGLGIYDTIQYINSSTTSVCTGMAASFGAVLLCACKNRLSLPHSTIMIHQPLISGGGISGQATELKIETDEMLRIKKTLTEIIAKHCNKPYEEVLAACERNNYMTPEQALEFGLIDKIITKKSDINK